MGTDLVVSRRAQLAGYAGLAGAMRGRRFAVIAAVDVLAVVLAFGAIHITGAMMGTGSQLPQLVPPVSAATEPVATIAPLAPSVRLVPKPQVFAAMPDAAVMFAKPVAIARGFTFSSDAPQSSSFTPPDAAVASAEPAPSEPPMPRLRPAAPVAQYDASDGSLDRLLLRDVVPSVSTGVANTATAAVGGLTSTVNAVTSVAPPVQALAQSVTAPVSQVVNNVVGLLN